MKIDEYCEALKIVAKCYKPEQAALAAYVLLLEFLKRQDDKEVKLKFTHDFSKVYPS